MRQPKKETCVFCDSKVKDDCENKWTVLTATNFFVSAKDRFEDIASPKTAISFQA